MHDGSRPPCSGVSLAEVWEAVARARAELKQRDERRGAAAAAQGTRSPAVASETASPGDRIRGAQDDAMGAVAPAFEDATAERPLQDRALASIEADLALVVSRGRAVADRFRGVDEGARADLAEGVFLALAESLLRCSELCRRVAQLRFELAQEL